MNLNTFAATLFAVALILASAPGVAQTPSPSAPAAAAEAAPADAPKKPLTRKEARAIQEKADARLCLEFPTQLMIVKCADKYRLNKRET